MAKLPNWKEIVKAMELVYPSMPEAIKEIIRKYPPDRLYHVGNFGKGYITMYERCVCGKCKVPERVTVEITADYNKVVLNRVLEGVPVSLLTECSMPDISECGMIKNEDLHKEMERIRKLCNTDDQMYIFRNLLQEMANLVDGTHELRKEANAHQAVMPVKPLYMKPGFNNKSNLN